MIYDFAGAGAAADAEWTVNPAEGNNSLRYTGQLFYPASVPIQLSLFPPEYCDIQNTIHIPVLNGPYSVEPTAFTTTVGNNCSSLNQLTPSAYDQSVLQGQSSFLFVPLAIVVPSGHWETATGVNLEQEAVGKSLNM